ncbi:hypothetical protein SAMN05216544_2315 [Lachnospira pectinoschiza]|uniref:Cyclophilin-like domain-containing protein n=2 Tax=Lachnospira pectinoschiza TaxID=28052 RepID=A0A1H0A362_9FIRM|nr:hypothetical protein SAMN05216544_2315 [Lachnospira pectinoschiza]
MKNLRTYLMLSAFLIILSLVTTACGQKNVTESQASEEVNGLPLSNMVVSVTCGEKEATFQLYDTKAAKELYDQLPLTLELSNFRDAQWMFYPPEKLAVTDAESYHDGKKGELSYYEPWGDVFMLYEDFYAGDEMHRLGVALSGVNNIEGMSGEITIQAVEEESFAAEKVTEKESSVKQIKVTANGNTIIYELNGSPAANDLYDQLPLTIEVQNYSTDEKIYYPPKELNTSDTPLADSEAGSLAYYAPWGDVVMFYRDFGSASGLYELGSVIAGEEYIKELSGTITIEKVE